MKPEEELSFFDIIYDFNRMGIRYLIIGRRAVVLYGAPVLTADSDFWVDISDRLRVLSYFSDKGCSLSEPEDSVKPIIQVFAGPRKIENRISFFEYRVSMILLKLKKLEKRM